jgi:hypothetical protein
VGLLEKEELTAVTEDAEHAGSPGDTAEPAFVRIGDGDGFEIEVDRTDHGREVCRPPEETAGVRPAGAPG